jgi:hypothetical protein
MYNYALNSILPQLPLAVAQLPVANSLQSSRAAILSSKEMALQRTDCAHCIHIMTYRLIKTGDVQPAYFLHTFKVQNETKRNYKKEEMNYEGKKRSLRNCSATSPSPAQR